MPEDKGRFATGLQRLEIISIAVLLLGIVSLGLVILIKNVLEQQVQDFIIVDGITDLRKDLTSFHLRLEEYLHGDPGADLEKSREMFREVKRMSRVLVTGGQLQAGFSMKPVDDLQIRKGLAEINALIDKLEERGLGRLQHSESGGNLTDEGREFEDLYNAINSRAALLEEEIEKDIVVTMQQFRRLYVAVLFSWAVIIMGAAAGFGVHARKRRRSEEELIASREKYSSLVDSTEDSIYLVDRQCNYLFINRKHLIRLALTDGAFLGRGYRDFHSTEETEDFREKIERVFNTGESSQYEHQSMRDGKYFLQTLSPVRDTDGNISAVTVVSKNISERKQMEDELRALSLTDELTGLYNRRGFLTLAEQQLKIASRLNKKLYLLSADLDDLKVINDSFGHHEGDSALIETSKILRQNFRDSDIIARIGGDEFVVMPIEMSDDLSETILNRLNQGFEKSNEKNKMRYRISISTGIVSYDPDQPVSVEDMLVQADKAMYEHKRLKKMGPGQQDR